MRTCDAIMKNTAAIGAGRFAGGAVASGLAMTLGLSIAAVAGPGANVAAAAEQIVTLNTEEGEAQYYVTPQAMIESTRQIAEGVSNAVNGQLAPAPPSPPNGQALGYTGEGIADPAAEAFTALGGTPAATGDFASTNQAVLLWNLWSDVTVAFADRNNPVAGYNGVLSTVSTGLDRKVGDSAVLGVLLNFEIANFDTSAGPGTFDSTGYGIGIYGGTALGENWVADAMVIWKHFNNDLIDPGISESFDSERWQAATNVTGYWFRDAWRYSPVFGVAWSHEDQDASAINPAQTVTTGLASAGLEIGYTTVLGDMRSLEPWAGLRAEWTFHDSGATILGPDPDLNEFDLRLAGGLNAVLAENFSLSLHADIAGLVRNNFLIGTIGAQAALQF